MDNQPTIDQFDSSIELNRTWYFERFSSILSDDASIVEEFSNQSNLLTNRNQVKNLVTNLDRDSRQMDNQLDLNLDSNVYRQFFEPKEFINSTYEELKNLSNWNSSATKFNEQEDKNSFFFSNSSVSSFNSSIEISDNLATNLQIQPILINDNRSTNDNLEEGSLFSQIFMTNLPSIQNLINDQMYFLLNSSNTSTIDSNETSFINSTLIQTDLNEQINTTSIDNTIQPEYNWIYIIVVFLIIFGVLGNCLVCLAICVEKRLQNATNYFLLSLAFCDLLVSLIVMPFLMLFDFYGYWPFNTALCNFWVTCDVLLCTSSIIHLLFISVTRYIGIRHPLTARRVPLLASRKAAMLKILVAWLLAAIISSPITILATIDTVNIQPEPGICAINNRLFFTLGSIVSFFLPMLIMVNTYILTIRLLKRKAKLCQKENASLQHQNNGSKPCVQCKVLVQDNSKRNNSKSSISSDYSTGLGTTTVKDLGYVIQSKRSKTDDNLKTTNNLSTTVHKDQLTEQTNKQMLAKRNLLSHSTNFSLFERWTRHCSTRHSKTRFKITNDKKSSSPPIELSQTTNGNGSAYNTYEKNNNFETNNGNKNGKTFKKSAKKAQRIRDYESGSRFQGIRVLFSKNKKGNKKSKKSKRKQEIEVQLNEQVDDEKSDEHDKRNENDFDHKSQIYKTNKIDNSTNCDIKQAKKDQQIMLQDQHKIRKSNTFSNLETVNNQKINTTEINNNHQIDEQEKRKQTFDKTNLRINNPSSLALLSPSTISHRTCRLSAHSDIKEISSGTKTTPVTPTTSSNPINSIQPVLVRTLGSSQVLTEQKATKVLGVVFFSFVFCWAPFFSHNFLAGVSPDLVKEVPKSVVSLLQWLGYLSSTLNPIIYTVFNAHFRRTFRKIILCQKLGERNKLKNSSPRLTASRMVSFRNSSFSRNQSSIIRKKTNPSSLNSNRSADLSTPVTNQKPSSFSYSTRSHRKERLESTNKQINELNLVKVVKTTENDLMLNIVHDSASQKQDTQCSSSTVLNELEKPGLK